MSRFREPQDPAFQALNASIGFDRRLWPHDVAQSRAHARMLAAQGIISRRGPRRAARRASTPSRPSCATGRFPFAPDDEDIHMAVERRLTELAGPVGGRLHTARSRNDQVATDVALFTREAALRGVAARHARSWPRSIDAAERHLDWPLPGYTHLQRAQPVYLSHHLLAYVWMLERDRARLRFAAEQTAALPLGAGALAGVNFDTDRGAVAAELGFERVAPNSIDAVSNRDFVLDYLGAAATCATHLSRLGAELVLWSSRGVRLRRAARRLDERLVDHAPEEEPRRRRAAAGQGAADRRRTSRRCTACMHALPLTYNKDLQEDKEHLFDAVDTLELCLGRRDGDDRRARASDRERMAAAAADELIAATDLADLLVKRGMPFREAHGVVAGLVREAVESGRPLAEVAVPALGDDAAAVLERVVVAGVEGQRGRDVAGARARAARARPRAAVIDARASTTARCSRSPATSSAASCATATPRA